MNLKPYIESGILELYALNSLPNDEKMRVDKMLETYPVLRNELDSIQISLESYANSTGVQPPEHLKERIIQSLFNLHKESVMDLKNLPFINRFSNYQNWLPLVDRFGELPLGKDGRHLKVLRHDEKVTQILIISTTDIEEETHIDEHESFLILAGECKCTIGGEVRQMGSGDFMEIPLHELHDVQVVSDQVVAILQRIKV